MPDRDPEPGEILRTFQRLEQGVAAANGKLDDLGRQSSGFEVRLTEVEKDVKDNRDAIRTIQAERDQRRTWVVATFVAPVITGVMLALMLAAMKL